VDAQARLDLISKILHKHDNAVNDDEGGERPFNRMGDALEALWAVIEDREDKPRREGWFD
jgi:hypothetical protein